MGRLAPVRETDMSGFEDAYDQDPFCHIAGPPGCFLCGAPGRSVGKEPHFEADEGPRCSCGKLKCPDCEYAWDRGWE